MNNFILKIEGFMSLSALHLIRPFWIIFLVLPLWGLSVNASAFEDTNSCEKINCETDFSTLYKLANTGDKRAQFEVGLAYEKGRGVAKSDVEAVKWYEKASDQGNMDARHNLAMKYRYGEGVKKDLKKATELGKSAAELGHPYAQNRLGVDYIEGVGVIKNSDEALKWFKKSANNGFTDAMVNLGKFYEFGWGGNVNYPEAFNWYLKAAKLNNNESQYATCLMYKKGLGVIKNNQDAYNWCKKAALNGHVLAMSRTGAYEYSAYPKSPENYKAAIYWWKQASDKGDLNSKYFLGLSYEALGNKDEAEKWFLLAAKQGQKDAIKKLNLYKQSGS